MGFSQITKHFTTGSPLSEAVTLETLSGMMETVADKDYILEQYAAFPYTVENIVHQAASGTGYGNFKINTTSVTGMESCSFSTSEVTNTATGENTVAIGDTLRLTVTGTSSLTDLGFTLELRRI